ncbi:amidohydrolase, partial [Zoogloea sp.]|uniref:amidohydrolase n=1 Tax=Zoogloea sp. TaxID=49181 RepID=UPI00260E34BD
MNPALTLHRLSVVTLLTLAAPGLLAQATTPLTRQTAPSVATAKPPVPSAATTPAATVTAAGVTGAQLADPSAPLPVPPPPPLSDIIFTNGDVITLDDKRPSAQAVAIKGSRIVAVGTSKAILARWRSEGTEVVDLGGKTLVPGFIDSWGQLSRLGLFSVAAQLQPPPEGRVGDTAALLRELREWGRSDLPRRFGWIVGFGYDETRLRELRTPTRNDLDNVSRDLPVIIVHQSGRQLVANSKALELAGITRDSVAPAGGDIGRWPGSREPDGLLEGTSAFALLGALPHFSGDERLALIQQGQALYLQNGYTTAVEGRATPEDFTLYLQTADLGALKLDVLLYADLGSSASALKGHKQITPRYYKGHLKLAGVSFALDGTTEDRSAWLTQPYQLPPPGKRTSYAGYPGVSDETAGGLFEQAYANGWQVAVHANGDAAIDQFLKGLQSAGEKHPFKDRRPLLVGGQTLRDDQLEALKDARAQVAFAPTRLSLSLDTLQNHALGTERTTRFLPAGSALGKGVPPLLTHDPAALQPQPLGILAAAIRRPAGDAEQLSPFDALKGLTLLPARQLGEEKIKGSITAGKLADLVVLSG